MTTVSDLYLEPASAVPGDLYLAVVDAVTSGHTPVSYTKNVTESTAQADSGAATKMLGRSGAESLQPQADSASRAWAVARTSSDSAVMADACSRLLSVSRLGSDGILAGDSSARVTSVSRVLTESTFQSDAGLASKVIGRIITETGGTAPVENATYLRNLSRSLIESFQPVADSAMRASSVARSSSDSLMTAESLSRLLLLTRSGTEMSITLDVAIRSANMPRTASESVAVLDSATRQVLSSRLPTDSLLVVDNASRVVVLARMLAEVLDVTDAASRLAHLEAIQITVQSLSQVRLTVSVETALV